jgi:hypothetical protein
MAYSIQITTPGNFKMQNLYKITGLILIAAGLSACQSAPRQFNGQVGYQIESKSADTATLAYTLAGRQNQQLDKNKLQRACQKVLGTSKQYKLSILSVNEIINPAVQSEQFGKTLGNSRTSVGLSNTPSLHGGEDYATRQSLDTRPATLRVVRYTCS